MRSILVVDDDQSLRGWLRRILEDKGYLVEEAGDGNEALTCIRRNRPDLIVLDLYMPSKEGLEVIISLRSQLPSIKILAVSGEPIPGYDACRTAKNLGAHGTLAKPFDAETILEKIETLLAGS